MVADHQGGEYQGGVSPRPDCRYFREIVLDRLQQNAAPDPAHAHFGAGHAKFLWQANRLAAAVFEKLCRPGKGAHLFAWSIR